MSLWVKKGKIYLVERNNIFISQRMGDKDGLFIEKGR